METLALMPLVTAPGQHMLPGLSVSGSRKPLWGRLSNLASKAVKRIGGGAEHLKDVAEEEGPAESAALAGIRAHLFGDNPVWAALKGAWLGMGNLARVATVVSVLLALLLGPVALLLLVVAGLIVWLIAAVRAAARRG